MFIHSMNIGFIEIPNKITLNIYTIGCKHNCNCCHSKNLQDFNHPAKKVLKNDELIDFIKKSRTLIDGICWLGGDPLEQESELILKSAIVKGFPNLLNILYTGYEFNVISESVKNITDIIVDGKFNGFPISDEKSNQKIYLKQDNQWKIITYNELKEI